MKKIYLSLFLAFGIIGLQAQDNPNLGIIPAPVSVERQNGHFLFDNSVVFVNGERENDQIAALLKEFIKTQAEFNLVNANTVPVGKKAIVLTSQGSENLPKEGYLIQITPKQIKLVGKGAGLFYATQSLIQMLYSHQGPTLNVPLVNITDYPRFAYRGNHLDVSRHFFPLSFIKKYIDLISSYKMNTFHWHLTDDQGWRIEIKKYPKLTAVGGYRNGTIVGNYPGTGGTDNENYGGFYTQAEAKEIVEYAKSKFVTVIPEIEMPGHASAAIAAYPELSAFPDRDTFIADKAPWSGSRKGKQVQQTWGVFDDVFVPTEYTFNFLQDVLDEVIAIFPSKYIHIGGDECPKEYWKQSEFCQALIKKLNLKDEHELQSYFIQRIEKYLNNKGRSIIGWDEILEGGLAPNATVMSWRGESGGIAAAQQNHDVIMTPASAGLYFDHKQSNAPDEPLSIGGLSTFEKVYNYNPVPDVLTVEQKKHILGVQANIWTEYIESPEKVEYHLMPRLMALSEIAWSALERKDFNDFQETRLPIHLAFLDKQGINFRIPSAIGQATNVQKGSEFEINLKPSINGARIYYTLDNYRPAETAALYTKPFKINVEPGKRKILKTIVIAPSGRRSVVMETEYNNGYLEAKKEESKK
ncbi:MAG: beta-N-acetylhexosaminidase [Pedobacter sp.]|nr:MAG: beta-N-acetylhexosaminidase [Pedobacter sp.]